MLQLLWSFVVAGLFVAWLTTPFPTWLSLRTWTMGGGVVSLVLGAAAVGTTRSVVRGVYAIVVGLLAAAVWLDVWVPDDVSGGELSIGGVLEQLAMWADLFATALGGAILGAIVMRWWATRGEDLDADRA